MRRLRVYADTSVFGGCFIVHFEKIAGFQAVNLLQGYKPIRIYSPREVVEK